MNYLWEIALKSQKQNRPLTSITFKQSATPSPYMEAAFADINWQELSDEPVEVNVLYRFSQIFAGILDDSLAENPDLRDALIDLLLHYLTLLDLRAGLCRQEYYVRFLREDIESGRYGLVRDILTSFAGEQIRYVLSSLVKLYRTGPSLLLLKNLLRSLYPKVIVYLHQCPQKELLLYLGKKENPTLRKQIDFICSVFVPLTYAVQIFWEKHFGIIGIEETMLLDEIMIF